MLPWHSSLDAAAHCHGAARPTDEHGEEIPRGVGRAARDRYHGLSGAAGRLRLAHAADAVRGGDALQGDEQPKGLSSPEAYADFAEQCLEIGYKGFKMHGWKEGNPNREESMISAVAERIGSRIDVMYDAACHLKTLTDAIRIGHVCDEHKILWFEDPYSDGGLTILGNKALKEIIRTPVMIGEHVISSFYIFNINFNTLLNGNFINDFLNCFNRHSIIILAVYN